MNELEKVLYRTRKTIREACIEAGVDFNSAEYSKLEECTSCNIWDILGKLKPDLDGNLICKECETFYGL